MTEVWLQTNRRAIAMGMAPTCALTILGAALLFVVEAWPVKLIGGVMAALGGLLTLGLLRQLTRPRIAYRDGRVLFYLRAGEPISVPREVVEAFFLGQGPTYLPVATNRFKETVNLVARMSQKAPEWQEASVKPALGHWCEGYVTIRGTWCEPLTGDVIRRLNARLRELRTAAEAAAAPVGTHVADEGGEP